MNNSTHCEVADTTSHNFFIFFYSLVFLVGLLLNGFTLKVYFCRGHQLTSSTVSIYLKNLAAADFLLSLCLPIRIANYASHSIEIRKFYCHFGASAFYLNMYASILFMGYIAANRYLKIVHPLGTHILQRVPAAQVISTVTWMLLLAMMSTYILTSLLTQEPVQPVHQITLSCDILHSKQVNILYKFIHIICATIFLVVLVSLVFFYYNTSRRLSLAQQRQPASSSSVNLSKSRRNMLVLVSVFCVCFVPYHLVRLPYAFLKKQCLWSQAFYYLKELAVMLSVLNVCLDPLLYFIFCKAYRAQLSLRRVFSTTHLPENMENMVRRTSLAKTNRKTSLSVTMVQNSMV